MNGEIVTLVEDTVNKRGLLAEHGLAFLVKLPQAQLLFDTGAGAALLHNAAKLDLDLSQVKYTLLSHGHDDHTGGLESLLEAVSPITVIACPGVFEQKYRVTPTNPPTAMGMPLSQQEYEQKGASFRFIDKPLEIFPGIWATGPVPRTTDLEKQEPTLFKMAGGSLEPDPVLDDQSLVINSRLGLIVILGCAHAGILNTLEYITEFAGTDKIHAVIGGPHLIRASQDQLRQTAEQLKGYHPEKIGLCHCTGFTGMGVLYQELGPLMFANNVGTVFPFELP